MREELHGSSTNTRRATSSIFPLVFFAVGLRRRRRRRRRRRSRSRRSGDVVEGEKPYTSRQKGWLVTARAYSPYLYGRGNTGHLVNSCPYLRYAHRAYRTISKAHTRILGMSVILAFLSFLYFLY